MKITFICPHLTDCRSAEGLQPLVFAILAGLTPPEIELAFFDERLEPIPDHHDTDLVALTTDTYRARRAYQIASGFRQRGIPVVMGGHHPTFLPEEALAYADAVVIGEAEGVWAQVVRDAQQGKLEGIYRQSEPPPLSGLRYDRSIFKGKRHTPICVVQFGRGCRFACDFCSVHAFHGSQARHRPVAEVVAEIEALDRKLILFIDDNLFVDAPRAEELFRALIPLNIRWVSQASVDIARNTPLMDLMAESGCLGLAIGFESLNLNNLKQMKKTWNLDSGGFAAAIREYHERGIMVYGTFVFGYDHDTVDSFDITAEFAIRSKLALANFLALTPTPGSPIYSRLLEENRLIYDRWWLDPRYRIGEATFHPRLMKAEELPEGISRAREMFFCNSSMLKRALNPTAIRGSLRYLVGYLVMNSIVRLGPFHNLGVRLGSSAPLEPGLENIPALPSSPDPRVGGITVS